MVFNESDTSFCISFFVSMIGAKAIPTAKTKRFQLESELG
jgi:hypothetical protein